MANRHNPRIPALAATAAGASAPFVGLAVLERHRRLSKHDRKAMAEVARRHEKKHERAANWLHPIGKWWTYLPVAVAAGAVIYTKGAGERRGRTAGAAAVPLAAVLSA